MRILHRFCPPLLRRLSLHQESSSSLKSCPLQNAILAFSGYAEQQCCCCCFGNGPTSDPPPPDCSRLSSADRFSLGMKVEDRARKQSIVAQVNNISIDADSHAYSVRSFDMDDNNTTLQHCCCRSVKVADLLDVRSGA